MRPWVGCSKPPIIRSVVVLPQPDGPRSAKKLPRSTSRVSRSTATTSSNRLVTSTSRMSAGWAAVVGAADQSLLEQTRRHEAAQQRLALVRVERPTCLLVLHQLHRIEEPCS